MLVLTNDTFTFTVPDGVARKCGTLSHAMDALDSRAGTASAPVPLPNVSSNDMVRIVQFYTRYEELKGRGVPQDTLDAWKTTFLEDIDRTELYSLMEAANYLDSAELFDAACTHVANLIKGRGPEEIRRILMLPDDTTGEERREMEEQFAWALK